MSAEPRGVRPAAQDALQQLTAAACAPVERRAGRGWWLLCVASLALVALFVVSTAALVSRGTGLWGLSNSVCWGWAIVNFVFWIGLAHAGTLISAILYLLRQRWRSSLNRFAEAMTLFAVLCALIYPAIHVGRPWVLHWLLPLPNQMATWPNFRSPVLWDLFAIGTYALVSLLFFYLGLLPDLATLRDRAAGRCRRLCYGLLALGWRGSARHWQLHGRAYLLLAGIATPLVISVHSVVSFDFAVAQLPAWHTTIFPPYFVVGAVFSGVAMVLLLLLVARRCFAIEELIDRQQLERLARILLFGSLVLAYAYGVEVFSAWYSRDPYAFFSIADRALGRYAWAAWAMLCCNVALPQLLWFHRVRRSPRLLALVAGSIVVGMWLERFVIVVAALHRDFLPSAWANFAPTSYDWAALLGGFGLFFALFAFFVRLLPAVAIAEVKAERACAPRPVAAAPASALAEEPR